MQLQAIANSTLTNITDEFHVEESNSDVILELCRIVAYYHLVEAVDNGSDIHSSLSVNVDNVLTYWVSLPNTVLYNFMRVHMDKHHN